MNSKGFGLIILIVFIALATLMIANTSFAIANAGRQLQLRIDTMRAYWLAQAGVMQTLYNWKISNTDDMLRSSSPVQATVFGNLKFRTGGAQSDYFYLIMNVSSGHVQWTSGTSPGAQLQRFQFRNMSSTNPIILKKVKLSWSPSSPSDSNWKALRFDDVVMVQSGSYTNGQEVDITASDPARTLAPGATWGAAKPNKTQFEWISKVLPDPIQVRAQWTFEDGSKSAEMILWNGSMTGGQASEARPFTITSTGEVDQTGGSRGFKVWKTVRATVSAVNINGQNSDCEFIDWDELDQPVP